MEEGGAGRGHAAHEAECDEGAVEGHDAAVVAVDAGHEGVADAAQDDELAEVIGGDRDVGDLAGDGGAGGDGDAGVGLGQGPPRVHCG